jgi:hypothetical protein
MVEGNERSIPPAATTTSGTVSKIATGSVVRTEL